MPETVLGLNAYHGDSSAALLRAGAFVSGVEEERLNRVKHWAGFPGRALASTLAEAGVNPREVAHVAVSRDPGGHLLDKALFAFRRRPSFDAIRSRLREPQASVRRRHPAGLGRAGHPRQGASRRAPSCAPRINLLLFPVRGGRVPHRGRVRRLRVVDVGRGAWEPALRSGRRLSDSRS